MHREAILSQINARLTCQVKMPGCPYYSCITIAPNLLMQGQNNSLFHCRHFLWPPIDMLEVTYKIKLLLPSLARKIHSVCTPPNLVSPFLALPYLLFLVHSNPWDVCHLLATHFALSLLNIRIKYI